MALGAEVKSYPDQFESPRSIAAVLREMAEFHLPPDYLDTFLARLQATRPEEIGKTMAEVVAPGEQSDLDRRRPQGRRAEAQGAGVFQDPAGDIRRAEACGVSLRKPSRPSRQIQLP